MPLFPYFNIPIFPWLNSPGRQRVVNGYVDLRSDTVTQPTPAMREAMARAEVGDDVFNDDPTVHRLEEMAAARMGQEAGLFVASGTMGNLAALLTHCRRGDEVIAGDRSHTITSEQGGMAALGGLVPRPLPNQPDGTLRLEEIEAAIHGEDTHHARTRLVTIENTHNFVGGVALDAAYTRAVADLSRRRRLKLHIDGARIFNAAVALGVPAADLVGGADSVTFCLSKGLSAPVGSVLCGTREFIAEARRARKVLGGGMRQVGVLAAAGIVALQTMVDRLAEDHANARRLAEGLAAMPGFVVDLSRIQTNIVFFDLSPDVPMDAPEVQQRVARQGVLLMAMGRRRFRAVTHAGVTAEEIGRALTAVAKVMA
ncbi:MAG: low-specificity L-threonine aldolase [Armatimonadetes bacterium]|nr:low-specificity L-threonine aldolase [Armatimonadota bacterium]